MVLEKDRIRMLDSQNKYLDEIKDYNIYENVIKSDKKGADPKLKKEALFRDKYKCRKCGGMRKLEAHHIIARIYKGKDILENYIILCHICHDKAPDEPRKFIKYLKTGLTPNLDLVFNSIKFYIEYLYNNYDDKQLLDFRRKQETLKEEAKKLIIGFNKLRIVVEEEFEKKPLKHY